MFKVYIFQEGSGDLKKSTHFSLRYHVMSNKFGRFFFKFCDLLGIYELHSYQLLTFEISVGSQIPKSDNIFLNEMIIPKTQNWLTPYSDYDFILNQ